MSDKTEELDFELKLSDILLKSNKRARITTFISIILLCAVILLYLFKPLIKTEPFVIQVDKTTGLTQMLSSVSEKKITYNEAIDKFFTSQYVKKREQYFYSLLSKDYVYVQLNSIPKVAEEYIKIYTGKESRDKVLGQGIEEKVKVLSVTLGENAYIKNATVRWFLSVNYDYIPQEVKDSGLRTYRSITVDGDEIEFSGGFTDLHTKSYEHILNGGGFGLDEAYGSIKTVSTIRHLPAVGLKGEYHPFCKKVISE